MTAIEQIEMELAELEEAAKEAAKTGMIRTAATIRSRAAGMSRALKILKTPLPETP